MEMVIIHHNRHQTIIMETIIIQTTTMEMVIIIHQQTTITIMDKVIIQTIMDMEMVQ